jgi:predicted ATPase
MWLKQLVIQNLRSFEDSGPLNFSKGISLLIGANNSGKTTILRCIQGLQPIPPTQVAVQSYGMHNLRKDAARFQVKYVLDEVEAGRLAPKVKDPQLTYTVSGDSQSNGVELAVSPDAKISAAIALPNTEPFNWIYPYLSKRKPAAYDEKVSLANRLSITESDTHLYSKVDGITGDYDSPQCQKYFELCRAIFHFKILCYQVPDGKRAGLIRDPVNFQKNISVEEMGEGGKSLLGLIISLCIAEKKLFLIEEPENDIHPNALKPFLDLIKEKSLTNQFIISTHDNIVVKHLGSLPETRLFSLTMDLDVNRIPTSTAELVDNSTKGRIQILESLGYDLIDFELYSGYLILEESSAERIINDILIPNFCPKLARRLRTVSSGGVGNVYKRFDAFQSIFVFLHVTEPYKDKAWVIADGGPEGEATIKMIQDRFQSSWKKEHFLTFKKHDFEQYYPPKFAAEIEETLKIEDKQQKRIAKKKLFDAVLEWNAQDPKGAKDEWENSAEEVIKILKQIEGTLVPSPV